MRAAAFVIAFLGWISLPATGLAQEWTRFRGPNGSGISAAATVPAEWNEADFNWRVELPGEGHSSPVLWGKKVFLTSGTKEQGTRIVLCLHADDGRVLWIKRFPAKNHRKHQLNSFASSTPAVDKRRVYLSWASPEEHIVQALDHRGEPQWSINLGPFKASHGSGVSPILYNGMVIMANEHQGDSSLVALDCDTGETRWRVPRKTKVTYITPCVYRPRNRPPELIFTNWSHGITAFNPDDGRVSWAISVFDQNHIETAIGSPIIAGDLVLGTCGWLGYGAQTVAVRPDDLQPGAAREVYRFDKGAPLTTTPVANDELLFLWADDGIVTCADAKTGVIHWKKRVGGTYYGSPVIVGDFVYCLSTDGKAAVIEASMEYRLVAKNPLGEGSQSTPSVADGVMYLRTFSHLISIGGK